MRQSIVANAQPNVDSMAFFVNVETILDVPRVQNNEYTLEKANEI